MGRVIMVLALAAVLAAAACGDSSMDTSTPAPAETQVIPTGTVAPAETSTPAGPSTGEVAALFADNCAGCHGADGGGGSGPDIRGEDNADRVQTQIESGGGGMPAFSGQLSPGQIGALAQYVTGELQ